MNEIAITIVLRQRYVRVKVGCMVKFDKTKKAIENYSIAFEKEALLKRATAIIPAVARTTCDEKPPFVNLKSRPSKEFFMKSKRLK
jgi:hypothetical protein